MTPQELFARWATWNERHVLDRAAHRAEERGDTDGAAGLRASLAAEPAPVSATEALAAQHELASLLSGWRWHTVLAAREQGATWDDIAAATGTDPTTAREDFHTRVEQARTSAEQFGIAFHDADRADAAARPDAPQDQTDDQTGDQTMTDSDDRDPGLPPWVDQLEQRFPPDVAHSTPIPVDDRGTVEGVIELPGGLPPDEDDDNHGAVGLAGRSQPADEWFDFDGAAEPAERDGFVVFDPDVPGSFRGLSERERAELDTGSRATPRLGEGVDERVDDTTASGDRPSSPAAPGVDQVPWFETAEGRAHIGRWAVDSADPAKAAADGPVDDPDELARQLDAIRTRLTGYTWREGADRDEALADRREQLGRWYADDNVDHDIFPAAATRATDAGDDDGDGERTDDDGPGWVQ